VLVSERESAVSANDTDRVQESAGSRERNLRARRTASLSITPVLISDENAPAVVGLEPRQFREFVARHRVNHARDGKRMLVRVDVFLAVVQELELAARRPPVEDDDGDVDAILKRLGRKRTSGGAG
jgi:hypothetical protein